MRVERVAVAAGPTEQLLLLLPPLLTVLKVNQCVVIVVVVQAGIELRAALSLPRQSSPSLPLSLSPPLQISEVLSHNIPHNLLTRHAYKTRVRIYDLTRN